MNYKTFLEIAGTIGVLALVLWGIYFWSYGQMFPVLEYPSSMAFGKTDTATAIATDPMTCMVVVNPTSSEDNATIALSWCLNQFK